MGEGLELRLGDLERRVALLEAFVDGARSSERLDWSPVVPDWQYVWYNTGRKVNDADE